MGTQEEKEIDKVLDWALEMNRTHPEKYDETKYECYLKIKEIQDRYEKERKQSI